MPRCSRPTARRSRASGRAAFARLRRRRTGRCCGRRSGAGRASEGLEAVEARVRGGACGGGGAGSTGSRSSGSTGRRWRTSRGGGGRIRSGGGTGWRGIPGVPVVWDFRTADVASGGEGAPLVPFFHFACARWIGAEAPVAFLNLGGVGNVTWVDPRAAAPEAPGALVAFDTGPGNALIDDFLALRLRAGVRRGRRGGGGGAGAGRGARRAGGASLPGADGRRSHWTGRIFTASSIGWRRSRPRTGRRRWRR